MASRHSSNMQQLMSCHMAAMLSPFDAPPEQSLDKAAFMAEAMASDFEA
jgi:hypothetical protein